MVENTKKGIIVDESGFNFTTSTDRNICVFGIYFDPDLRSFTVNYESVPPLVGGSRLLHQYSKELLEIENFITCHIRESDPDYSDCYFLDIFLIGPTSLIFQEKLDPSSVQVTIFLKFGEITKLAEGVLHILYTEQGFIGHSVSSTDRGPSSIAWKNLEKEARRYLGSKGYNPELYHLDYITSKAVIPYPHFRMRLRNSQEK